MTSERPNHPTASGVERLVLCPGSWQLEQKAPPQEQSEDAATGDRIHAILAGKEVDASEEEKECAKTCEALTEKLISDLFRTTSKGAVILREKRFHLPGVEFSGKPDFVLIDGGMALIVDYKTGRGDVADSSGNWQLLSLAVLIRWAFPEVEKIYVAIIQPWVSPQTSACAYEAGHLRVATETLVSKLSDAHIPDAKRIPGEKQCKYCKAKSICPEAQSQVAALVPADYGAMAPAVIGQLLEKCIVAEGVIESIRTRAKEILFQAPDAIPGWSLEPGAKRRIITNTEKAYQNLAHVLTGQEFASCCKVTLGKLEKLVQKNRKMTANEAKDLINKELSGVIIEEQNKPSLARV